MKLTYRGVSYEHQPATLETTETEITGKYRGVKSQFRCRKSILVPNSSFRLKYRGLMHLVFGLSWYELKPKDISLSEKSTLKQKDEE
ncbi:MAG: DUF4278 domain-containing protein [Symploca sp. SIO1B1]|nr:DUF4278 domain-containing protein [Symploca sp. SIO2D2]NER22304.1 DUF4278 domain-containing protein [Symploca sp. SIO1C2]NER45903.1 DUF4278 domain-containing protein [Symploca sp. SIO1A3]NER99298.1 DUF4278 domain-containing protein [Symploca sp. SIO1B1]